MISVFGDVIYNFSTIRHHYRHSRYYAIYLRAEWSLKLDIAPPKPRRKQNVYHQAI